MESIHTNFDIKETEIKEIHPCACGRSSACDINDPCPDFPRLEKFIVLGPEKLASPFDILERLNLNGGCIVRAVDCSATEISEAKQTGNIFIYKNAGYIYKKPSN